MNLLILNKKINLIVRPKGFYFFILLAFILIANKTTAQDISCAEFYLEKPNIHIATPQKRGMILNFLDLFKNNKSYTQLFLEKSYGTHDAKELLKTRKKIKTLFLENNRKKWFERNYMAAISLLRKQGTGYLWTPHGQGYHRGMLIALSEKTSRLNQQVLLAKKLTGYDIVYSADYSWGEKMAAIFSGAAIDLSSPEAGADRTKKVIYSSAAMVIEGKLTHIEEHELGHALLNKSEDEGVDTGILLPKVRANSKDGFYTGIESYPRSIDFQELYTFAAQIRRLGNTLVRLKPKSNLAQDRLDELQEYIDNYIDILVGLKKMAHRTNEVITKTGVTSLRTSTDETLGPVLEVKITEGLTFLMKLDNKTFATLSEVTTENTPEKTQVLSNILRRIQEIENYCNTVLNTYDTFFKSETKMPYDKSSGLWTTEFVDLFETADKSLHKANKKFLGEATEINSRIQQLNLIFQ